MRPSAPQVSLKFAVLLLTSYLLRLLLFFYSLMIVESQSLKKSDSKNFDCPSFDVLKKWLMVLMVKISACLLEFVSTFTSADRIIRPKPIAPSRVTNEGIADLQLMRAH